MENQTVTASLEAQIQALRDENARLVALSKPKDGVGMKVSAKGALSVYGLGRFPVTLYRGQWERLLAKSTDIAAFIEANKSLLQVKE